MHLSESDKILIKVLHEEKQYSLNQILHEFPEQQVSWGGTIIFPSFYNFLGGYDFLKWPWQPFYGTHVHKTMYIRKGLWLNFHLLFFFNSSCYRPVWKVDLFFVAPCKWEEQLFEESFYFHALEWKIIVSLVLKFDTISSALDEGRTWQAKEFLHWLKLILRTLIRKLKKINLLPVTGAACVSVRHIIWRGQRRAIAPPSPSWFLKWGFSCAPATPPTCLSFLVTATCSGRQVVPLAGIIFFF